MKTILSTVRGWVLVGVVLGCGGAWGQEVCTIPGSDGLCKVVAFPEDRSIIRDKDKGTCLKLLNSEYQGACTNGSLEGIALIKRVHADGITHYLVKFRRGVPAEPRIDYTQEMIGVMGKHYGTGCVYYGNSGGNTKVWDVRANIKVCQQAEKLFGDAFFSDETFKAIRNGSFRLANQQRSKPSNTSSQGDDPKVFGRSARGG